MILNVLQFKHIQAYSSLFNPLLRVIPSPWSLSQGSPRQDHTAQSATGSVVYTQEKSPCQNRNTMTIHCGGTVLAKLFLSILWLLNQTDISQWDLLVNISQIDRNFKAKLPSVFWLRPIGIWLYRCSLHICDPEITQGPAIKRGNGKSPRNGGFSSHDCQRVAKSTRTITVAGTKTTFVNRIWTDLRYLSLVNLEISSIQWPREAL